jgi:RNA polymerase sporulation-specific sigma factor
MLSHDETLILITKAKQVDILTEKLNEINFEIEKNKKRKSGDNEKNINENEKLNLEKDNQNAEFNLEEKNLLINENIKSLQKKEIEKDLIEAKNALQELVVLNSPLVKSIVKRYLKKNTPYDDLFQLGSMGLIKAIKNFDAVYGVRFSTYAVPMIAGEIKRFLRDDGAIKVSRSVKMLAGEIKAFVEAYKSEHDKSPEINEIANNFNVPPEDIIFAMEASKMPISLFQKTESSQGSAMLMDKITLGDETEKMTNKLLLKNALKSLTNKEQKIILLRFYRGKTQAEVAEMLGVSQVQVSRLEQKLLEELKQKLTG